MGQPIFLDYDREALDREYDNRGKVADFAHYLARYATESAAARRELPCRLDVRYGPGAGETLDIFPAPGSAAAPIHVFVHGGYWRGVGKAAFNYLVRGFRPAGGEGVVVHYRPLPLVRPVEPG